MCGRPQKQIEDGGLVFFDDLVDFFDLSFRKHHSLRWPMFQKLK